MPLKNALPPQDILHKLFEYDAETGGLRWRDIDGRPNSHKGKDAGTPCSNGYRMVTVNRVHYRVHRIAWVYVNGDMPDQDLEIDHVNGDRADNRISNLRLATKSQNMANSRGKSRSGLPKGVERNKGRFTARIMIGRVRECLGTFDTPAEAHEAYRAAAFRLSGEFARAA